MLGKLIKHDFKAIARILVPIIIAIIGATLLAAVMLRINITSGMNILVDSPWIQILSVISTFFVSIMIMGIFVAFAFMAFIVYRHFYKNLMSSEGYLTFTLPTTPCKILWSKFITAMVWMTISAIVGFLCINLFLLFATPTSGIINPDVFNFYGAAFEAISHYGMGNVWIIIFELLLLLLIGVACGTLHIYLALIIGGAVAQKNKLLAGIGFYFIIELVIGAVGSILQIGFLNNLMFSPIFMGSVTLNDPAMQLQSIISSVQPLIWSTALMAVAFGAFFFVLSNYLLKKKLNLA